MMKFAVCLLIVGLIAVAVKARAPDTASRAVTAAIKSDVENKMSKRYTEFVLIDYEMKKVKKGTKYILKVKTNNSYLHVQVYQSKNGKNENIQVKAAKKNTPLKFFD